MTRLALVAALTSPLVGCFGTYRPLMDDDAGTTGTTGTTGVVETSTSSTDDSDSTSGGADESSSDTTTGEPVRDTTGGAFACDHIDVLVVIDMSMSMEPYINNGGLLMGLFGVSDTGLDTLRSIGSFHLGLTTNGGLPSNAAASNLPETDDCTEVGSLIRPVTEMCEGAVGEQPFIDESSNEGVALSCLIVGALSDTSAAEEHRTLDAIGHALSPDANAEGSCNAGFRTDGAPLLIVVASDGEDLSTLAPQEVAAPFQTGNPSQVAVAVFGGPVCACEQPEPRGCNDEGCAATPPCALRETTNLLFASVDPEEQTRFTGLCSSPDEIEAALEFALNDLASLACEGAAAAD